MSLQLAILGLISFQPMTGYELKSTFDYSVNHFWSAQLSQIYRELGVLEKKNYLESHVEPQRGKPDKKIYTITPAGKKAFQKQLGDFPSILSATMRDEFLLRVFFGELIPKDELDFQLRKFIKEKNAAIEALHEVEAHVIKPGSACNDNMFFPMLTLKKGLMFYRAEVEWAEYCLQELSKRDVKSDTACSDPSPEDPNETPNT